MQEIVDKTDNAKEINPAAMAVAIGSQSKH